MIIKVGSEIVKQNELKDWAELVHSSPNSGQPADGWVVRSRCDGCRSRLGFLAVSLCVKQGTVVLCRVCATE